MAANGESGERVLAGRYRLGARLGRGGMGTVWRAEDQLLGRAVAVKELHLDEGLPTLAARNLRSRTLREARTVAQVVHPHILVVHDVVEEDERPWIVMELVTGSSLANRIAEEGPLAPAEAARIALALAGALRAAHDRGVLHRDLKPANVLLEAGTGRVVLTDFGIAQMPGMTTISETGAFVGSPEYTAPERMEGKPSDGASDLWSLGVLLCAAVAGETPFWRDNLAGVLHAVAMAEIRIPESVGPLRPVVDGLLRRDPAERMALDEVERLLRACAEQPAAAQEPAARAAVAAAVASAPVAAPASAAASAPVGASAAAEHGDAQTQTANNRATLDDSGTPPQPPPQPAPQSSTPTPTPTPPPGEQRKPGTAGRGRVRTLAIAVVAAVVGGGVAVGVLSAVNGGTDGGPGGGADPSASRPSGSAASPGPAESAGPTKDPGATNRPESGGGMSSPLPAAPDGYRTVRDPAGFRIAVPEGFTRSYEPPRVYYYAPGKTFRIGIHIQDREPGGAMGAMREAHEEGPSRYPGYRDGSVRAQPFDGFPGALWQFAWDGEPEDGGARYTYDQSWDASGQTYDVWVSAPEEQKALGKQHFDTALRSFTLAPAAADGN